MKISGFLPAAFVVAVHCLAAGPASAAEHVTARQAFDALKALAGDWEGTAGDAGEGSPAKVSYKVTAHGTAVMEVLFPGTGHEMVSMYHLDGDKLLMTHYCAMGNQPRMALDRRSTARELKFNFAGGTNLKPGTDAHMHAGRIRFIDADTIESSWEVFEKGQKSGENQFWLKRKK